MKYSCKARCATKNLKTIRDFVIKTLQTLHMPEEESDMMVLAVDEVCSNLIIHSNDCDDSQFIEVVIKDNDDRITFEIYDQGRFFDNSTYEEPSLARIIKEKRKGGMGLMLVKRIMDEIEFVKEGTYNICRLSKKLTA